LGNRIHPRPSERSRKPPSRPRRPDQRSTTHRIGQTRSVFAYRLIARDTVEEKVLELQGKKRALADAIIRADDSLIRSLTRQDLELLLS
jgi:SNF2 family DNA or RNA helicase